MGIVVSMFMIAVGAIMRFAVSAQTEGWNVHTAGMVLMVVGGMGAVLSIAFWASWGGFDRMGGRGVATGGTTLGGPTLGGQGTSASSQRTTTIREREDL
ncbi:MAG: hypothetical protein ACSLFB_09640 [Acidimicrobiales bacterium]